MPRRIVQFGLLAMLLLTACTDENTTNNNFAAPGNSIYGRVLPQIPETEVAAWQAEKVASTVADAEGYFSITDLEPGLYRIEVTSPSGYHSERGDVNVGPSEGVPLLITMTDAPGIMTGYQPAREAAPLDYDQLTVSLRFSEKMDLASLAEAAAFEPATVGEWRQFSDYDYYQFQYGYRFYPAKAFRSGSDHALSLSSELLTADGQAWGHDFSFPFRTTPFQVRVITDNYYADLDDLSPAYTGELATITFTMPVDLSSAAGGITSTPPMSLRYEQPNDNSLRIRLDNELPSGTDFMITIGPGLLDINGDPLAAPFDVAVRTQNFQLESRSFHRSPIDVPPGFTGVLFTDTYNAPVDLESVRQSLTVTPPLDVTMNPYTSYGSTGQVQLEIKGSPQPGTEYLIRFGPDLSASDGSTIGQEQVIRLTIAPLQVSSIRIRTASNYYSTPEGVVDPDALIFAEVAFNAPVDHVALSQGAQFDPPINGYWFGPSNNYTNWTYTFFPTEAVPVSPGGMGRLTIRAGVPLSGSAGVDEDYVVTYRVAPVQVRSGTPSPGSSTYQFDSVRLTFNTSMNPALTQGAFTLKTSAGQVVPGAFRWSESDRSMEFDPTSLSVGTVYEATLSVDARSATGHPLGAAWSTVFRVSN